MLELWPFSVIALNDDVSGRSHFTEIISLSFSILLSVESASIRCKGTIGRYFGQRWSQAMSGLHIKP